MINKLLVILTLGIAILLPSSVMAYTDTIDNIEMNIYVDSTGTANVTEVWTTEVASGTENYKPYGNLGNSNITDFSVTDEKGTQYTYINNWNVDASKEEKDYKNGINVIGDGIELCFGLGDYGDREYTLKYKITNFVNKYNDSDGIYFSLMPDSMDPQPNNVEIRITSDTLFDINNSKIWAFGYNGDIVFDNGAIVMKTNYGLSSSDYMVALVKINSGIFNSQNIINKDFSNVYDEAMADTNDNSILNYAELGLSAIFVVILFLAAIVAPIMIVFGIMRTVTKKISNDGITTTNFFDKLGLNLFGSSKFEGGKILPKMKEVNYWREIPCNKDLVSAYWVGINYGIISEKSGLIGAILLKWVKLNYIDVTKTKAGFFSFKDNNYAIDLSRSFSTDNEIENKLYTMLIIAAGSNTILEAKEFEYWCKRNYTEVEKWFREALTFELKRLEMANKVFTTTETNNFLSLFNYNQKMQTVSAEMKEEAIKLLGLKRFLLDFSIINEREVIDVRVWEEYLIYAQLLGIADKVDEQLSKLYPEYSKISRLNTEVATIATRNFAHDGYAAVINAHNRNTGYSSGGGGSSHSSGGSSSSGHSSGGGRR